ncbi:MAG: amino acid ABC transporter substrate-binding protein [Pseudonocardia sp.]|nr:amino acid ABC transporter substrate-binding protein [Pseudonocardia sp.]
MTRSVRTSAFIAVGSLCTLIAAACGAPASSGGGGGGTAAGGEVVVGAPVSLSGKLAKTGLLTKEGYEFCADTVNAKGGIPLADGTTAKMNVKFQDDTSVSDVSAQIVDQFNDEGIKFILSPYGSSATAAAAPVVERNGQLMADSLGTDDTIFTHGYTRTFGVMSTASEYAGSMITAINELAPAKPATVAIISADDGFSKTVAQYAKVGAETLGWKVTQTVFVPNNTTDVATAIVKVRGDNPDLVVMSGHLNEGTALIKQAAGLGLKPQAFAVTVAPPVPDFAKTLGATAEGVLGSSQWVAEVKAQGKYFGTAQQYSDAYTAKYGHAPDYHSASGSGACIALALAIEKAGTTDVDKVRGAMAALDADTFYGHIKFDETGKNIAKPMVVVQVQNGKAVPVWPKAIATAELKWPATGSAAQ